MDLKLFFDPVSIDFELQSLPSSSIAHSVFVNQEKMPEYDGFDIAIIGLRESRGASEEHQAGLAKGIDAVRKAFYSLKKGAGTLRVVDLGTFRNGPDLADTYLRLKEVCAYLMSKSILPLLVGGSHDLDLGQYMSYENQDKLITVLSVDNKFDLLSPDSNIPADSHVQKMIKYDPNFLFNYYHLASQAYLVGSSEAELIERLGFEAIRLGMLKENVKELEPVVRDADLITFDISALQAHYCPGAVDSKVYGLTGEEACQLCWYAGLNDKLSSVGLYGFDQHKDDVDGKTAFVVATMMWYFIEGFYNRKGERNFMSNDYLVYEVSMGGEPSTIKFYKSKSSEKWWMEVPHPEDKVGLMRSKMIPCSYTDYEEALKGEVPNRWISTYTKFV